MKHVECIDLQTKWHKSNIKFDDRFDKYLDPNFFQHRVSATSFLW